MNAGRDASCPVSRRHAAPLRTLLRLLVALSGGAAASALTLDIPRLPAPAFADREVCGDTVLPANAAENLLRFRIDLAFEAGPFNNVQVAFGRDAAPTDGQLAAEETDFIVGWDGGAWFLRPQGLRERHVFAPADGQTPRRRALNACIAVDARGIPKTVTFGDDAGAFAFAELALDPPPAWLTPGNWDLLRVTVRGAEVAEEDVLVRFQPDGAAILVR